MSQELKAPEYYDGYGQALQDFADSMKNSTLRELQVQLTRCRGEGSTTAALNGVMNTSNAKLLFPTHCSINGVPKDKIITFHEIKASTPALVIDNYMIFYIIDEIGQKLDRLADENRKLKYYQLSKMER